MKTVSINVPDNFNLDPWWSSASTDVVCQALNMVPELVRNSSVTPDTLKRIKELEFQLEGSKETALHAANAACDQVSKAFNSAIEEKERMCEMMKTELQTYKDLIQQFQSQLQAKDERHSNELTQLSKTMQQQQPTSFLSAQQAGNVAESDVEALVADCLVCDIEDVSKIEGRGDRHITTPDGLKLLQETKNVEKLHSKHDIEKFKRDVHEGIVNGRINAAILISLKSQTIPNHGPGPCSITFNHGPQGRVPVIMLASNNRNNISLALQAIVWLQDLCHKEFTARGNSPTSESEQQMQKEQNFLQEHIPKMIESAQISEVELNTRIDMLKTLLEAAENERVQNSELRFTILKLQQNIPWLMSKTDSAMKLAEKIVSDFYNSKNEYPKSAQLTLAQRTVVKNAGGIKVVLDHVKKRKREELSSTSNACDDAELED